MPQDFAGLAALDWTATLPQKPDQYSGTVWAARRAAMRRVTLLQLAPIHAPQGQLPPAMSQWQSIRSTVRYGHPAQSTTDSPWFRGSWRSALPLPLIFAFSHPRLWWLLSLLFVAGFHRTEPDHLPNLTDRFSAQDQIREAQAWFSTVGTTGAAAGTAAAGIIIDRLGLEWSFAAAAAAVLVGSALCTLQRDR